MGVGYLTSQEIRDRKEEIVVAMEKGAWMCRDSKIQKILKSYLEKAPEKTSDNKYKSIIKRNLPLL